MKIDRTRFAGVKPVTEPELRQRKQARSIKATVKRWTTRGLIEPEALIESLSKQSHVRQTDVGNQQPKQEEVQDDNV